MSYVLVIRSSRSSFQCQSYFGLDSSALCLRVCNLWALEAKKSLIDCAWIGRFVLLFMRAHDSHLRDEFAKITFIYIAIDPFPLFLLMALRHCRIIVDFYPRIHLQRISMYFHQSDLTNYKICYPKLLFFHGSIYRMFNSRICRIWYTPLLQVLVSTWNFMPKKPVEYPDFSRIFRKSTYWESNFLPHFSQAWDKPSIFPKLCAKYA